MDDPTNPGLFCEECAPGTDGNEQGVSGEPNFTQGDADWLREMSLWAEPYLVAEGGPNERFEHIAKLIEAALAPAYPPDGEPAAWMVVTGPGTFSLATTEEAAHTSVRLNAYQADTSKWDVVPLFTHPPVEGEPRGTREWNNPYRIPSDEPWPGCFVAEREGLRRIYRPEGEGAREALNKAIVDAGNTDTYFDAYCLLQRAIFKITRPSKTQTGALHPGSRYPHETQD